MTSRQRIETSREIRLWTTGIVGPIIMGGATILAQNPDIQRALVLKIKEKGNKIKAKLIKK